MTPEQADTLAKRIINTFRHTPALTEWRHVLNPLDHHRATTTYELCRDTIADNLPIARYIAEYRHQSDTTTQPSDDDYQPIDYYLGRRIAYQAYAEECLRQGRKPNRERFATWLDEAIDRHPSGNRP